MTDTPKNPQVAKYIEEMHAWRAELEAVRPVLLRAGLDEELKWYKPCYSYRGANVVIFQPFSELCALLFFKGALLQDPDGALRAQGENTRSALRLEFRCVADVTAAKRTIVALVQDAIRVEDAGLSVPKRAATDDGPYPEELEMLLDADAPLRGAYRARRATDLGRLRDARLEVRTNPPSAGAADVLRVGSGCAATSIGESQRAGRVDGPDLIEVEGPAIEPVEYASAVAEDRRRDRDVELVTRRADRYWLTTDAPPASQTSRPRAASLACARADSIPSLTK
jgi:uncharacterized protein YdeI (YjbR/CyaY-like superfamily)